MLQGQDKSAGLWDMPLLKQQDFVNGFGQSYRIKRFPDKSFCAFSY